MASMNMPSANITLKLGKINYYQYLQMLSKKDCIKEGNCLSECIAYKASANTTISPLQ